MFLSHPVPAAQCIGVHTLPEAARLRDRRQARIKVDFVTIAQNTTRKVADTAPLLSATLAEVHDDATGEALCQTAKGLIGGVRCSCESGKTLVEVVS